MGVYGSPQLGVYAENIRAKKLSNPILIVVDAIALLFCSVSVGAFYLLNNLEAFALFFLLVYGLIIGLTVGLFKKIRKNVSNKRLLLVLCATLLVLLICAH